MAFEKKDVALFIVALSLISLVVFVGWGAIKGLLLDDEIKMTAEQYGTIFSFAFGVLVGSGLLYLGIRAGQSNGSTVGQT